MNRVDTVATLARSLRFFTLLGLVLAASPAFAFKLVPFSASFTPTGSAASQTFRIDNDSDQPIAVQISVVHRNMGIDGKEELPSAEDDFAVFPAQLVLLAKEGRTVRVQWLGDPAPKAELPFRLIAEQLPVELNQQTTRGAQIKLLVRYEATVYVTPPGAKADLSLVKAEPVPGAKPMLSVIVRNSGTAHAVLDQLSLTLKPKAGGSAVTLSGSQLEGMATENVLGGHDRRFVLPWPAGLPVGEVDATMKVAEGR